MKTISKKIVPLRPHLVTASWLHQRLQDTDILLLDASPTPHYLTAHIPGAISVSFPEDESTSQGVSVSYGGGGDYFFEVDAACAWHEAPDTTFEKAYRLWGVSPDKTIVLCDMGGTIFATRLFFSLCFHGFPLKNIFLLDGGLHQWQAQGFPVTSTVGVPRKQGDFRITRKRRNLRSYLPEIVEASGDPTRHALVEGLLPAWHTGAYPAYSKAGHIPHAISLPYTEFYNEDKTFKSDVAVRRMLRHLQIRPTQRIHTHCGGGIAGSVPFFAIRFLAGYPDVRHFIESQVAYLNDSRDLAFWTYDAPYRLRDTAWLQWWGGQRTRTLGSVQVSIIDVRTPRAFRAGHIPFSLNVPITSLMACMQDAQALGALLGKAGVNPRHEAVIVSGDGADKQAMLAALILDNVGHKKVSVFSQTLVQWQTEGYPVTDKPTVVAPKKLRFDLAIPPVVYQARPTSQLIIRQRSDSRGLYSKLIIESGPKVSARTATAGSERCVHLPASTCFSPDGGVKSAAEITAQLDAHGIHRFAEIITTAKDPADAAALYFVLRLLGYPDVKVWIG